MNDRFARHLGSRQSDPEYANALEGPRPSRPGRIRNALAWALGIALLAVPFVLAHWSR